MFLSFFRLMLPIALFQRSPADLPHSSALCFWAITWAFVLSVSADVLMGYDAGFGIVRLVLSLLIYGLLLLVVLRLVNKKPRFLQTYTASVGAGATLLVLMVFVGLLMQLGFTEEELFGLMPVDLWSSVVGCLAACKQKAAVSADIHGQCGGGRDAISTYGVRRSVDAIRIYRGRVVRLDAWRGSLVDIR
ncbi:MAG: hypothetical protein AAAFM81_13585 [Pseudomonadota bacterium]